ncbi:DUF935 domain-containing protein [Sphingomonas sp. TX0522]|uniref:DUF935 domain-containing protein n=1 Tax=Sphingomonas sp. TX0522 TaxID=2479205 RepID=UPI0018E03E06|nr:DUF935 domain-containing protein [Sphingomonas sp. TX0522]
MLPATTTPPPLVWSNGQLMRPELLRREIAGAQVSGVRSIISGHPAQGLTPQRLAGLLRAAEQGDAVAYLELAEEMEEKDLHYLSVLGTRKRQVSQLPIEVIAAGEDDEAKADAQLCRDWLDRDLVQAEMFDMLDAIGKGFSATEIVWEFSSELWLPSRLMWRDPRFFEFDALDGTTLRLRDLSGPQALPAAKFIVHYHQAKSGLPIRGGLARAVAWSYMFKNYAIKDWVAFLETYGMPLRIGRYDNGETEANIATLMGALADLGSDAAAVFPKSMEVQFVDGKAGTAPGDLWKAKADFSDSQVSKAVLGQTGTTDSKHGGIGDGGNKVHDGVRQDIETADAMLLAATLNEQLIKPMVMLNRGVRRRYPRLRIGRPDAVDVKAMTEAAAALVPLGAQVDADAMVERAGLPKPKPGGRILQFATVGAAEARPGISVAQTRPAGFLAPSLPSESPDRSRPVRPAVADAAPVDQPDAVERAADDALDDWERLIAPVLAPVRKVIDDATSLDDIRASLAAALDGMDVEQITEKLAQAAFSARIAGDAAGRGRA